MTIIILVQTCGFISHLIPKPCVPVYLVRGFMSATIFTFIKHNQSYMCGVLSTLFLSVRDDYGTNYYLVTNERTGKTTIQRFTFQSTQGRQAKNTTFIHSLEFSNGHRMTRPFFKTWNNPIDRIQSCRTIQRNFVLY